MPRPTPFVHRSRRHRRDRFVSERWKIRNAPEGQGLFRCRHLLPGTPAWEQQGLEGMTQSHADIRFLSRRFAREGRIYLGRLSTVEHQVLVLLEQRFEEEIDRRVTAAGLPWSAIYPFDASEHDVFDIFANAQGQPQNVWQWLAGQYAALTPSDWEGLAVETGERLSFGHPLGVEFIAVWPVANLTPEAIAQGLERFLGAGEEPRSQAVDWAAHRHAIASDVARQAELFERLSARSP